MPPSPATMLTNLTTRGQRHHASRRLDDPRQQLFVLPTGFAAALRSSRLRSRLLSMRSPAGGRRPNLVPTMLRCCSSPAGSTPRTSRQSRLSSTAPRRCRGRCWSAASTCGPDLRPMYSQTEAPLAITSLARTSMRRLARAAPLLRPAERETEIRLVDWTGRARRQASPARLCCARPSP
jgi:hypothetical protein